MFNRNSTTRKRRSGLGVSAVTAVLALAAFGATSAAAHTPLELSNSWYTGTPPSKLSGTKTVQTKSVGTTVIEGSLAERGLFPVKIRSTGVECLGCVIENSGSEARLKGSLKFTGVTLEGGRCAMSGTTLQTKPIVGTVDTAGVQSYIEILPTSGTGLASIEVVGAECALAGLYQLTGGFLGHFVNARNIFRNQQEIEFSKESNTGFRLAGQPATLSAGIDTSLSPELSFGLKEGSTTKEPLHEQFISPSTTPAVPRNWYTGAQPGTKLVGTKAAQMSLASERLDFSTTVGGSPLEFSATSVGCSNCKIEDRAGTGENKSNTEAVLSGELSLGGLSITNPSTCSIASTLKSKPVTGVVGGEKGNLTKAALRLIPNAGLTTSFFTVEIVGENCSVAGLYKVTGGEFGEFFNPLGVDAKTQRFGLSQGIQETLGNATSLKFGENPLVISGEVNLSSETEFQVKEK